MEVPLFFRCLISMELMKDPVTTSTGVTYERENIEKWLHTCNKNTCPATMQPLESFDLTPNHTLKRLMLSWQGQTLPSSSSFGRIDDNEVVLLLRTIESTPFKVRSLKKLRSLIEKDDETGDKFMKFGGIEVLGHIIFEVLKDNSDFASFCSCEEALGVLYHLPLLDASSTQLLFQPKCIESIIIMLQRGSAEARLHAVTILKRMVKIDRTRVQVISELDIDFFKSLLELLSDEICTRASSCALDVLIETLGASRKNRLKAIEAGAVCVLIELLLNANRSKCERMLFLLKLICDCAEGRSSFVDHGLAISIVVKKILHVSELGTKLGVKILWLVISFLPTERVLEDMLMFGAVKKLLALLHMDGRSSKKDKAMKIIRLHGNSWKQYPCFPGELTDYLILMQDS